MGEKVEFMLQLPRYARYHAREQDRRHGGIGETANPASYQSTMRPRFLVLSDRVVGRPGDPICLFLHQVRDISNRASSRSKMCPKTHGGAGVLTLLHLCRVHT